MSFMEKFGLGKKSPIVERKVAAPESINQQLEKQRTKFSDNWKGLNADVKQKGGWGKVGAMMDLGMGISSTVAGVSTMAMGIPAGIAIASPAALALLIVGSSMLTGYGVTKAYSGLKNYIQKYS